MSNGTQLRNDIQGLRALAVLSVILFHLNKNWLPGGFIGVDIFFVISGFLITSIILRKKHNNNFSLSGFYLSRIQRIAPAYYALLAITAIIASFFLIPVDFGSFLKSAKAALLFESNSFFASQNDYFAPAAYEQPLLHTWSLAIEMQFYLLLPVLLLIVPRRYIAATLSIIAITLTIYSEVQLHKGFRQSIYFSLANRVPEFLIGALIALIPSGILKTRNKSNYAAFIGLLLLSSSMAFINEHKGFPGAWALPACIGVALLILSKDSFVNQALSIKPLVFVGALSYSLYLWHWPTLALIRYLSGAYELGVNSTLAFAASTFIMAYISYKVIETPLRGASSNKMAITKCLGLFFATIGTLFLASSLNSKLVAPLPENLTRYAPDAEICHSKIVGECLRGDISSNKTLLMVGDSHAAQLNYFADVVGNATHTKISVISASNCVTIPGFDSQRIVDWARAACNSQIEEAKKYTPSAAGIIIAGMWQYQSASTEFMQKLDEFISEADKRNQKVLVLAQVPMMTLNPQRIYRANTLGMHLRPSMNTEWVKANEKVRNLTATHPNATFLDLSKDSFFKDIPLQDDTLIYLDNHHLNEVGSTLYGKLATPALERFIKDLE